MTALYILLVFTLVLANGFFVASEFALVGVRRSRIQTLADGGNRRARLLLYLLDNLNAYISATQLGITMASLALGWIGEPVFARLLEAPLEGRVSDAVRHTIAVAVAFTVITFLHIVLGELAPKTLALERAEKVALAIALPLQLFYKVFCSKLCRQMSTQLILTASQSATCLEIAFKVEVANSTVVTSMEPLPTRRRTPSNSRLIAAFKSR